MKAYSNDLRREIVAAYERGHRSRREIAELFGVRPATVRNFVRRKRERGSPDELPRGGGEEAVDPRLHLPARPAETSRLALNMNSIIGVRGAASAYLQWQSLAIVAE